MLKNRQMYVTPNDGSLSRYPFFGSFLINVTNFRRAMYDFKEIGFDLKYMVLDLSILIVKLTERADIRTDLYLYESMNHAGVTHLGTMHPRSIEYNYEDFNLVVNKYRFVISRWYHLLTAQERQQITYTLETLDIISKDLYHFGNTFIHERRNLNELINNHVGPIQREARELVQRTNPFGTLNFIPVTFFSHIAIRGWLLSVLSTLDFSFLVVVIVLKDIVNIYKTINRLVSFYRFICRMYSKLIEFKDTIIRQEQMVGEFLATIALKRNNRIFFFGRYSVRKLIVMNFSYSFSKKCLIYVVLFRGIRLKLRYTKKKP
nr:hypothetical protein [Corynespora cassiicola]UFY98817.1 hypothetical protein [Corynespora cassiicola]